jgi:hypothetical protein
MIIHEIAYCKMEANIQADSSSSNSNNKFHIISNISNISNIQLELKLLFSI